MISRNVLEQELTKTEFVPNLSQPMTPPAETAVERQIERLSGEIVADAMVSPSCYLRQCVTGHDGE